MPYNNNQVILARCKRLHESHATDNPRIREQVIGSLAGALNRHMSKAPTSGRGYETHAALCRLYREVKDLDQ